jgi:adenylate kinase
LRDLNSLALKRRIKSNKTFKLKLDIRRETKTRENKMSYLCNAILIFGPPGVGKGTQGKILNKKECFYHLSSGELFRSMNYSTSAGKKVKECEKNGEFVSDGLVMELFRERLETIIEKGEINPKNQYLLLDGIPRTVEQVEPTNNIVKIKQIIYLNLDDENILRQRILNRAKVEGRIDDNPDFIHNRMLDYRNKTLPVLNEYDSGIIVKINGIKSIEEVTDSILEKMAFPQK